MANRPYLAIALAVWMTWVAFAGLSASALPNKIVAGGVFGPGNDMTPGPANPANAAGVTFFSVSQSAHATLWGDDSFAQATGSEPAIFAKDVGATWNWADGDQVFVVVETTRGNNSWSGVNYTTAIEGTLRTGASVQDLGNGVLAALPTLSLTAGGDYVDVRWTALTVANVTSYHVWTAPTRAGPWSSLATVNQGPTPAHNDTGLSTGQHCYTLGVNYRRDLTSGVYETRGRSEVVCATITGVPPTVVNTNPASGASNVAVNSPIVVTFSEPMNTATLAWSINPTITLVPTWNAPANTVVTFTHVADFTQCTVYTMTITTARDLDGNNIAGAPYVWSFTTFCPSPYVVSTSPVDGATAVPRSSPIVITFSEAMNTATVVLTYAPAAPPSPVETWSGGNTVLTVTHGGLTAGTAYTVTVAGQDTTGNPLVAGPVPNPFDFTTNTPPTAVLSAPGVNVCRTGGASLDITWTMSDLETPTGSLRVWLNYTDGVTTSSITSLQTPNSPETYSWSTPNGLDADVTILLEVRDSAWESAQDTSAPVRIDSTPPTVLLTSPAPGSSNVATDVTIVLTFAEAMDTASAQAAISFTPAVAGLTFSWSAGNDVVTVGHPALQISTPYTVNVGTGARDACTPGLTLATQYTTTFTTGTGARAPNPPTGLVATTQTATSISFSWTAPTTYNDLTPLPASEISGYRVHRATSQTGTRTDLGVVPTTSYTDTNVQAGQTYFYWVKTIDITDVESDYSAPVQATAGTGGGPGFNWLVILIPLIVILLLVGAFLLMRKRRPAAAPPKAARAPPVAAPEETKPSEPMEEATAEETGAGEEKFIPCPNCGTMVKPTDAECFVCGAKL